MSNRLSWHRYFINLANAVASRSTCVRRHVGAVAVNSTNHKVIGTGYNGVPSGVEHCTDETCLRNRLGIKSGEHPEVTRALHAEQNLVAQHGDSLMGNTVYCTNQPCVSCFKSLIAAGVTTVVWEHAYDDPIAQQLMAEWGSVCKEEEYHVFVKR